MDAGGRIGVLDLHRRTPADVSGRSAEVYGSEGGDLVRLCVSAIREALTSDRDAGLAAEARPRRVRHAPFPSSKSRPWTGRGFAHDYLPPTAHVPR